MEQKHGLGQELEWEQKLELELEHVQELELDRGQQYEREWELCLRYNQI